MKKKTVKLLSLVLSLLLAISPLCLMTFSVSATPTEELTMDVVYADNMVLQRQKPIYISGSSFVGDTVTVSLNGATQTATAGDDGKWTVILPQMEAGGPYTLDVQGTKQSKQFNNVMLGEVWVCAGQSNMEWTIRLTIDQYTKELVTNFDYPNIRFFAQEKMTEGCGHWDVAHSLTGGTEDYPWWSVTPLIYAHELYKALGGEVPVGVMMSACGGLPIQTFLSKDSLKMEPELTDHPSGIVGSPKFNPNYETGYAYDTFIEHILPYTVRGVAWYQGEQNGDLNQARVYDLYLQRLIDSWRIAFNDSELPFIVAQLPSYYTGRYGERGCWPILREKISKVAKNNENVGMAVLLDYYEGSNIHPTKKITVAQRFTNIAMGMVYGKDVKYKSPSYSGHIVEGNSVVISFDNAETGLTTCGKFKDMPIIGFQIAGADGQFYNAKAEIVEGNKIKAYCDEVTEPEYIRYAFAQAADINLASVEGLFVDPFRTDDMDYIDTSPIYPKYENPAPTKAEGEKQMAFTTSEMTYIDKENPNNVTIAERMRIDDTLTGLMKFDINLPAYCNINEMILRLREDDSSSGAEGSYSFRIVKTVDDWNMDTVNYNNKPATDENAVLAIRNQVGHFNNNSDTDIVVNKDLISESGMYGFALVGTEYSHCDFTDMFSKATIYINYTEKETERLAIETNPDKTRYLVGENFNPDGMVVRAYFTDGTDGIITNYSVDKDVLSLDDTGVTVSFGGATCTLPIKVGTTLFMKGDANLDDSITILDALSIFKHISGKAPLTGDALLAADANSDQQVTILDALAVFKHISGKELIS